MSTNEIIENLFDAQNWNETSSLSFCLVKFLGERNLISSNIKFSPKFSGLKPHKIKGYQVPSF